MTSKRHGFKRGRRNLLHVSKGNGSSFLSFDLVYNAKGPRVNSSDVAIIADNRLSIAERLRLR